MWNFKGYLWNSTQNIWPIHWKIMILSTFDNLRALRFKSSKVFLKRPPAYWRYCSFALNPNWFSTRLWYLHYKRTGENSLVCTRLFQWVSTRKRNSNADALELHLSCTNPSIYVLERHTIFESVNCIKSWANPMLLFTVSARHANL